MLSTRGDVEVPALRLSRIDLPARRFSELLVPADGLRVIDLREAETDGALPVTGVDLRSVLPAALPMLESRPEITTGCLAPVAVEELRVPIELPIRDLVVPAPEVERLLELAAGCLAGFETDGLPIRVELLPRD